MLHAELFALKLYNLEQMTDMLHVGALGHMTDILHVGILVLHASLAPPIEGGQRRNGCNLRQIEDKTEIEYDFSDAIECCEPIIVEFCRALSLIDLLGRGSNRIQPFFISILL